MSRSLSDLRLSYCGTTDAGPIFPVISSLLSAGPLSRNDSNVPRVM